MSVGKGRILEALGAWGVQAIAGSGLFWAWFDALFMGVFFSLPASHGLAEWATVSMDASSALAFLAVLLSTQRGNRLSRRFPAELIARPIPAGLAGLTGSLAFIGAGLAGPPALAAALLLIGGALTGLFCSAMQMGWGALYSAHGSKNALSLVSGGFAVAVVVDLPLALMFPPARALLYAALPLASACLLRAVPVEARKYRQADDLPRSTGSGRRRLNVGLGLSSTVLVGLMLVMVGFGYIQHLVSFASPVGGSLDWGMVVQMVRGLAAVVVFAVSLFAPKASPAAYRTGLLVMIAGFMANVFFLGADELWVSGSIVIIGYTVFDILVWVVAARAAATQSHNSAATVAFARMLAAACYVLGAIVGMGLAGSGELSLQAVRESNVIGYLVVVAVVVLLSSDDIWALLSPHGQTSGTADTCPEDAKAATASEKPDETSRDELTEKVIPTRIDELCLTARERDVAILLVRGRTQPWIAESLGISANTVGTHMRHIYQKAGVHNRREFMDYIGR